GRGGGTGAGFPVRGGRGGRRGVGGRSPGPRGPRPRGGRRVPPAPWGMPRPPASRSSPASARNRVLLPAPLGPNTPSTSPARAPKLTSRSTSAPPSLTERRSAASRSPLKVARSVRPAEGDRALHLAHAHPAGGDVDAGLLGGDPPLAAGDAHPAAEHHGARREVDLDLGRLGAHALDLGDHAAGAAGPGDVGAAIVADV